MSYLTQKTIKNNVTFNGIALHSGLNVNVTVNPAGPNSGIVFKRIDLKLNNLDGMKFNLIKDEWSISSDKSVNYICKFIKN